MGYGPLEEALKKQKEKMDLPNVTFYDSVSKSGIPSVLAAMDASVIPLKKLDLFKGAIPSKIFENLAMKKPILLGVEGEAKDLFIDEGGAGLAYEPENDADLAAKLVLLSSNPQMCHAIGNRARKYAEEKFNRDKIARDFYGVLKEIDK